MSDVFEELFAEAEADVEKQQIPEEWGPKRQTEEGERLLTRFIGREEEPPFGDIVFRFVTYPGKPEPFHLKRTAQLERVLENATVGDVVGLVRGKDKDIGRERPMQTWAGFVRPCDEPLGPTKPAGADSDIPF